MLDAWGQRRSQDFFPFLNLGKVLGTRLGRVATVKKLKADVLSHYSPSSQLSISFRWQKAQVVTTFKVAPYSFMTARALMMC